MTRMATVAVLKPHHNEFGAKPDKVPAKEAKKGDVSEYALPLDYAEMLERQGLVEIKEADPDPDAEVPVEA